MSTINGYIFANISCYIKLCAESGISFSHSSVIFYASTHSLVLQPFCWGFLWLAPLDPFPPSWLSRAISGDKVFFSFTTFGYSLGFWGVRILMEIFPSASDKQKTRWQPILWLIWPFWPADGHNFAVCKIASWFLVLCCSFWGVRISLEIFPRLSDKHKTRWRSVWWFI
jgi:hypothetical protein